MGMINQLSLASAFVFPRTGDSFKIIFVVVAVIAVLAVIVCLLLPKFTKKKPEEAAAKPEDLDSPAQGEAIENTGRDLDAGTDSTHSSDDDSSEN